MEAVGGLAFVDGAQDPKMQYRGRVVFYVPWWSRALPMVWGPPRVQPTKKTEESTENGLAFFTKIWEPKKHYGRTALPPGEFHRRAGSMPAQH